MEPTEVTEVLNALEESLREPVPMAIWYDELAEERTLERERLLASERRKGVWGVVIMIEAWIAAIFLGAAFLIWAIPRIVLLWRLFL